MARATWNGRTLAESTDVIVVEGNVYFPADAVDPAYLRASDHHTVCGWKGVASYHHVEVDGQVNRNAAWYYPDPKPAAKDVKGRIAFWHGVTVTR